MTGDGANLLGQAAAHFRASRYAEARALLDRVVASGRAPPQALLMLAFACRQIGDDRACSAALDRLLEVEPRAVRGLLMKGDLARDAGDQGAAVAFYRRALGEADAQPGLPADLETQIEAARTWLQATEQESREAVERRLAAAGLERGSRSPRFQQSLEILFGEKQIYLQQPSVYYFPGLPTIQFYEREDFGWVDALEAQTGAIREELQALLGEEQLFRPYLVSNDRRPPSGYHGMVDNPDWSTLYLWSGGKPVPEIAERCPRTMAALDAVPLARISVRAPVVMFSQLKAGARIPPHNGSINARLICHLPLIVPPRCGFRVGNEVRDWEPGKLLVFDDTIEHEAWNESGEDRIVLIFDIWRPELSEAERRGVARIFEAVDAAGQAGTA